MIGDLHVHTTRSDGSYSPRRAVVMARERGLSYIGIVDHDRTEGLEEAIELGLRLGVAVVPGVEISAYDYRRGRKAHLLGYRCASPAKAVESLCAPIREARDALTRKHVATLAAAGYPVTIEEVVEAAGGAETLYKQHIMAVLVRKGAAERIYGELYRRLFRGNGICAEDIAYADVFGAMRAIHADGGISVLAHPGQLDSWELLHELLEEGLGGVELYHESHSLEDHRKVFATAETRPGLVLTGGSDDHGSLGSDNAMGDIRAPQGAFEALGSPLRTPYAFVEGIVREAGSMLRAAAVEDSEIEEKGGDRRDIVTRHDSIVQEFLISAISERLPDHRFLAEEGGGADPEPELPTWIIDPIDGTTNFACSGRDFSISVALYRGGRPELGFVYDVMADEMYAAAPGLGAYLNGSPLRSAGRATSLEGAVVDMSMDSCRLLRERTGAEAERLALAGRGHRALGCASLSICRIARGSLDMYVSAKLSIWDHAAADIVLAEAGGASALRVLPGEGAGPRSRRFYAAAGGAGILAEALRLLFGQEVIPWRS